MLKSKINAQLTRRVSRVLRATRKHLGLSQQSIATRLGLTQSALSRVESGTQIMTVPQWIEFCNLSGISSESLMTGYVEGVSVADSGIRLPKKFRTEKGSRVRGLLPFLGYFEERYSEKGLTEYLESEKIDSDFFVHLENRIHFDFLHRICRTLVSKGDLRPNHMKALFTQVGNPAVHGKLHYGYDEQTSGMDLIGSLVHNSQSYTSDFSCHIDHRTKHQLDISVLPDSDLAEEKYRHDPILKNFFCHYIKGYFQSFSAYGGANPIVVNELECHYSNPKADRCIYQIREAH